MLILHTQPHLSSPPRCSATPLNDVGIIFDGPSVSCPLQFLPRNKSRSISKVGVRRPALVHSAVRYLSRGVSYAAALELLTFAWLNAQAEEEARPDRRAVLNLHTAPQLRLPTPSSPQPGASAQPELQRADAGASLAFASVSPQKDSLLPENSFLGGKADEPPTVPWHPTCPAFPVSRNKPRGSGMGPASWSTSGAYHLGSQPRSYSPPPVEPTLLSTPFHCSLEGTHMYGRLRRIVSVL